MPVVLLPGDGTTPGMILGTIPGMTLGMAVVMAGTDGIVHGTITLGLTAGMAGMIPGIAPFIMLAADG